MNRMLDALVLFEQICRNPLLAHTDMILFFNKKDVLEKKLKSGNQPVSAFFPDYHGPNETKDVCKFFKKKFTNLSTDERSIYIHFTTGTDIGQMKAVAPVACNITIKASLKSSGLL